MVLTRLSPIKKDEKRRVATPNRHLDLFRSNLLHPRNGCTGNSDKRCDCTRYRCRRYQRYRSIRRPELRDRSDHDELQH